MISSNNKVIHLLLAGMVLLIAFLWLMLRPVKIVAVHQQAFSSDVLVRNFPFTTQGKINLALKNQEMFKRQYVSPRRDTDGGFTLDLWLFDAGDMEREHKDRYCFQEMKTEQNCIDKNRVFTVRNNSENMTTFITYNGRYITTEHGKIVKHTLSYE